MESLLTLKLFINTSLTDTSLHLITMEGTSAERDDYWIILMENLRLNQISVIQQG